jgi:hypothetical protein
MAFLMTPPTVFIFLAIPIGIIFLGLALMKIDDIPIYLYLYYFLNYLVNPRRYIYSPEDKNKHL